MSQSNPVKKNNLLEATVVFLVMLLTLAVRFLPWRHVFDGGRVYFYDPDSYSRLRKALAYLYAFPTPRIHDYFQGFPEGADVITPPVIEYAVALLLLPFRSWHGLESFLAAAMAVVPPLLGAATVGLFFAVLRRHAGILPALAGALVLALNPAFVETTEVGRFDNEMLETILLLLLCHAYAGTMKEEWGHCPPRMAMISMSRLVALMTSTAVSPRNG